MSGWFIADAVVLALLLALYIFSLVMVILDTCRHWEARIKKIIAETLLFYVSIIVGLVIKLVCFCLQLDPASYVNLAVEYVYYLLMNILPTCILMLVFGELTITITKLSDRAQHKALLAIYITTLVYFLVFIVTMILAFIGYGISTDDPTNAFASGFKGFFGEIFMVVYYTIGNALILGLGLYMWFSAIKKVRSNAKNTDLYKNFKRIFILLIIRLCTLVVNLVFLCLDQMYEKTESSALQCVDEVMFIIIELVLVGHACFFFFPLEYTRRFLTCNLSKVNEGVKFTASSSEMTSDSLTD